LRVLLRLVPLRVLELRPEDADLRLDVVRREGRELCALASVFCAWSKSRFRAVASLPESRLAFVTNFRRSWWSERVPLPASRPACLRSSLIAFWAASSDWFSCLTAAGCLKAADLRDVDRADPPDLRDVERVDFLAGGIGPSYR
jgi:hypothetical protein